MTNPRLHELNEEMWKVQQAKYHAMSKLIKEAVADGVHVEIIVTSAPGQIIAWELWEHIGFPEGTNEFTHVILDKSPIDNLWSNGKGLSILYSSIAPPSRM